MAVAPLLVVRAPGGPEPQLLAPLLAEGGTAWTLADEGALPAVPDGLAGLVLLGGPAAGLDPPDDDRAAALLELIRACRGAGFPVLGLDRGARLIARAFGAGRGRAPEFGFVDAAPVAAGRLDPLAAAIGDGFPLLQWHEDELPLPPGAELLLRGERDRVQAFRLDAGVYAFQAQLDLPAETVRAWGAGRAVEKNNPAIAIRLSGEFARHGERSAAFARHVLGTWLKHVAG